MKGKMEKVLKFFSFYKDLSDLKIRIKTLNLMITEQNLLVNFSASSGFELYKSAVNIKICSHKKSIKNQSQIYNRKIGSIKFGIASENLVKALNTYSTI